VLVYIGDLTALFTTTAAALRPGGVFLFSAEAAQNHDYILLPTQRFAHAMQYLERIAAATGLTVRKTQAATIRLEKGQEVPGHLVLVQKV